MSIEIRVSENFSDEERQKLFGWGKDIFGVEAYDYRWQPKRWHVFLEADGELTSHVGLLSHVVKVGGEPVAVGGVGGVVTRGDAHGRGYATEAMRFAASYMCEQLEVDFGMLFCRDLLVNFYRKLGWQLLEERALVEQPTGKIPLPFNVFVLPCRGRAWPQGSIDLDGLPW
jgi:aminoglycoside 2'-N-acetyltransferase I